MLVTEEMVKDMKHGSVVVDLAVGSGGNCPISEIDKVVTKYGTTLIGHSNMAGLVPGDASALYSRNLVNFITPMIAPETNALAINWDDEIIAGTAITRDGQLIHPIFVNGEGK